MSLSEHEGIIDPSVDELLGKAESKYGLVIFAARRARQINAYYSQLQEGLFEHVGPLVDTDINEKSLSIAMREIDEGAIEAHHVEGGKFNENGQLVHDDVPADFFGTDFFPEDAEINGDASVDFSSGQAPEVIDRTSRSAEQEQTGEDSSGEQA